MAYDGYDDMVYDDDEAHAEMALGHMQQAREHAYAAGHDPDEYMAGYYSIDTAGALPGGILRPPPGAFGTGAPAAPRVRLRLPPGALMRRAAPAAHRALRQRANLVVPAAPGPVDVSYLPLVSAAAIAAGASVTIAQTSQTVFKPHRLNIPRSIADFFLIDNFSVGNVPLSAAAGQVPAASFATDATQANVRKVTANPGVQIVIQVTNIDGAAHRFLSTLFGWSAQPEGCR